MKTFFKNILFLVITLILSYYTSLFFGAIYYAFAPDQMGTGVWIGTPRAWQSIIGAPLAYIFFLTLIFKLFASGNKNKWIGWLIAPALLFFAAGDLRHIYLPLVLALIAWGISWITHKSFRFRF